MYPALFSRNSGGVAWAPRNVEVMTVVSTFLEVMTVVSTFMGAQERGDDGHDLLLVELADGFEELDLAVRVKPVPALDLYAGGSMLEHGVDPPPRALLQILLGRIAHLLDGAENSSAPLRDLAVGEPCRAHGEFLLAASGEYQVGVRVDEARHHHQIGRASCRAR